MRNHSDYFSSTCSCSCPFLHHLRGIKQTCNLKFKQSSRLNVIGGCCRRRLQAKLFCFSTFKHTHTQTHMQPPTHAGIAINWQDESDAGVGCQFSKSVRCPASTVHCPVATASSLHTLHTHIHDVLCATKSINSLFCCCVFCCPAGRF